VKAALNDLAVFGGRPCFECPLHVGRPHIGSREALQRRLDDLLDRRWLTNDGPYVHEFEARLADYVGVEHCVATCNATLALQIVARAMELTGEVILPSLTFVATAHALVWEGLTPVFCDVDSRTNTLDPDAVEGLIGEHTAGIVGVHLWGTPCDVEKLSTLAEAHGLRLMFDAAQAFGCSHGGRMIGGFGDAEVFSFHATKVLNSFEGGAITTNDARLAERARLMRNFGFADVDQVESLGTNAKMTEVAAAMGLTSLESLDTFIDANRANFNAYREGLGDLPGLSLRVHSGEEKRTYHHVVVDVDAERAGISRDLLHRVLHAENVLARRYFYPGAHRAEPYRSTLPGAGSRLPVTESIVEGTLAFPSGGELGPQQIGDICELARFAVQNGREISARLRA
jgi:dTDP-4-amino-4,6-dideoxygalactose transaminase